MGGPPVDNVALDKEGERMLLLLAGLSGVIGLGLSWWFMQNARLTAIVIATSCYSAAISLAIGHVHRQHDGLDPAQHALDRLHDGHVGRDPHHQLLAAQRGQLRHGRGRQPRAQNGLAPLHALGRHRRPGLVSLCTSELKPIDKFGLYAAAGVMGTLSLLYIYVPSALTLWGPKVEQIDPTREVLSEEQQNHRRRMRWIADLISGHQMAVWAIVSLTMAVMGYGLTRVTTSVDLMSLFSKQIGDRQSYAWLEEHLGPLVPMEIVLRLDEKECKLTFLERMELVQRIQRKVETLKDVGSSISTVTFATDIEPPKSSSKLGGAGSKLFGGQRTYRAVLNKRLTEHRDEFLKGDYLAEDAGQELWRINVRVAALQNVDYGAFVDDIKGVVEPIVAAEREKGVQGTRRRDLHRPHAAGLQGSALALVRLGR